ncbi:hypothetical protein DSO57_1026617 [Entomophthora muscae]|uniref:Uncharacterized protein n=1 Tax=Entomophthora muscae TaxID=34485 RepID=A0ACC2SEL9_9FUNG|nr:hypothetical protein DSO57_1026617 [Entomophthora muscae]
MSEVQILNIINSGDIASLLDLIGEDRSIDLNATYPWDAANTCTPFKNTQALPNQSSTLAIPSEQYQCTPINLATLNGNKSIVRILLQNGADPNTEDSRKRNALICALYGIDTLKMKTDTFAYLSITLPEYLDLIRILIPHMVIATMNRPLESLRGTSMLCFACYLGKLEAVKLLLASEHTAVNAADCKGATALMYAVREGHFNIIRELVKNKAKPELTNQEGFSAIQYARNSPSITQELERALSLERLSGMDLTQFSSPIADFKSKLDNALAELPLVSEPESQELNKNEPIIDDSHQKFLTQVQRGEIKGVQQQIIEYICCPRQQKASLINFHDRVTGLTPMHKAVCNGNDASLSIIESLFLAGSDLNSASWSGRTPLHHLCILASQSNLPKDANVQPSTGNLYSVLASRMVDLGALLNVTDKKGKTPLHYAVKGEESVLPLVSILLSKGADPLIFDMSKRTSIDSAENPAIQNALKDFIRVATPEPEAPLPSSNRRRVEASVDFDKVSSKVSTEPSFEVKRESSSGTLSALNETVQYFLDQYRIFDSAVALECLPSIRDIRSLVSSRVIAGGVRHEFNLAGSQEIASFVDLLVAASFRIENAFQQHALLSEKQEAVVEDIHARYWALTQKKDSMVASWRQGADTLPQTKQDLRSLATRLSDFKSECSFLVKSLTNKRLAFLGEFQRQMAAQKCNVQDNIAALTNLVAEEVLDYHSISALDRRASSESGTSDSSRESADPDGLENQIRTLTSISRSTQAEINRIKAKLSELRDQKDILFTEFTTQFSASPSQPKPDALTIPLSDLAIQAEMLTSQHERLLGLLERHIDQNERQTAEISELRCAMYKQTPGDECNGNVSPSTEPRAIPNRPTTFGGARQQLGEVYPPPTS